MTRKDYILIAAALKKARSADKPLSDAALSGVGYAAFLISESLARDNPRFDRERFLKAAGVQS